MENGEWLALHFYLAGFVTNENIFLALYHSNQSNELVMLLDLISNMLDSLEASKIYSDLRQRTY